MVERNYVQLLARTLAVPATIAVVYYISCKCYAFIPLRYQYVPGTFTGWLSQWLDRHSKKRRRQRPIRVYLDGCFDLMHYGHANALRQASTLGDVLVVGVNPDEEILQYKGPPVMDNEERVALVQACKWVDEVIPRAPYVLTKEFMDVLFQQHKIDYIVHGDDPCLLPDGTDVYDYPKKIGRFRMVKRTEGVSTTDIVGRMLMCGKSNHLVRATLAKTHTHMLRSFSSGGSSRDSKEFRDRKPSGTGSSPASSAVSLGAAARPSSFLPTSHRIVQFASPRAATPGGRVVYIDGGFDVFHLGHVAVMEVARAMGDYLLVGVHSDAAVTERRGEHLPIMSVHERSLSVMACSHADEVILGAPAVVTPDLIKSFNIALVVRGTISETVDYMALEENRYRCPRELGIFRLIDSPNHMTTSTIIKRIIVNQQAYEARQAKKVKSEQAYYETTKQYVDER